MANDNATYDVFIAYDRRDSETAKGVAEVLRSYNLAVFVDTQQQSPGVNLEDAIWQAMAESRALVIVLPEDVGSAWLAFELGAAKAWNKPIYAVSASTTHRNLPAALRDVSIIPPTRTNEIALSVVSSADPLTEAEIKHLGDAYVATGLSLDQLLMQPQQLAKVVKQFNKKSGRKMAGEQVMWHMLRLRKQGKLPTLDKRNTARQ
jgi:hypothetical protein